MRIILFYERSGFIFDLLSVLFSEFKGSQKNVAKNVHKSDKINNADSLSMINFIRDCSWIPQQKLVGNFMKKRIKVVNFITNKMCSFISIHFIYKQCSNKENLFIESIEIEKKK